MGLARKCPQVSRTSDRGYPTAEGVHYTPRSQSCLHVEGRDWTKGLCPDHALPASWPLPIISHHYLRMILSPQSASRQGMELLLKKGVGCSQLIGPLALHPPTLGWPESTTNTSCHFLSRPGLCKPSLPPCPSEAFLSQSTGMGFWGVGHPSTPEKDRDGSSQATSFTPVTSPLGPWFLLFQMGVTARSDS